MESKHQILLFNRKEVFIILILFILVALFSFTLGLRLGRTLNVAQQERTHDLAPFKEGEHAAKPTQAHESHEQAKEHEDHATENGDGGHKNEHEQEVKSHAAASQSAEAEDAADIEFAEESKKEKLGTEKPVATNFPKEKKTNSHKIVVGSYTLQVGSHRTVEEANQQVSFLKEKGLEASFLEAKLPGRGVWYRVHVGNFASKEAAETAGHQWKTEKGLPSYIVQKTGE